MNAASLRTKFLLIVLLGAVLPLAVVGWWLTGTAERSGRDLLHGQLDATIDGIASDARRAWVLRSGDLQLLASNTVVRSKLGLAAMRLPAPDSLYLAQLFTAFHAAFPSVSYVDASGQERWSFSEPPPDTSRTASERADSVLQSRTFPVEIPVLSADRRSIGSLRARVRISSILTSNPQQHLVPGWTLGAFDGRDVVFSTIPDSINVARPADHSGWEIVSRTLESPHLRLVLAAPSAAFVRPFERAARAGLGVLMGVALIALLLSAMLTGRVTGQIERMAVAAEAVAAGDLHGTVEVGGRDEIGRLAGAFNAMTESLRRTLAELSQQRALAAVGEFAASLSHDVRNALTAMRIDLQHATRQMADGDPATPLVKRTLETVRRLDTTVTGALRVARSGQTTMSRIDLALLLRHAMTSAAPSFAMSGATLAPLTLESEHVDLDGDAGALEQLFLNLLLNAAQAMNAGGVGRVSVQSVDGRVSISIIDTGPGVDAAALREAGAFVQSTKSDGTGLGLPIARRIATAHGGDLRIESVVGNGTTVIVTLPMRHVPTA
jgi:signal transduction histidine kinase